MNDDYINTITQGDCLELIPKLTDKSIKLFLSDIPYGISLDDWDVLHNNTYNSSNINSMKNVKIGVHVLNWGNYRSLMSEVSAFRYLSNDEEHFF